MNDFAPLNIQSPLAPISLLLQPRELQSIDSSFRCQITVAIEHPSGRFTYSASDIWLLTEHFDRFVSELSDMTQGLRNQAKLRDMSQFVVLTVTQEVCEATVALSIFEPWPTGAEGKLSYYAKVEAGFPAAVLAQLRDYDRWWRRNSG